MQCSTIAAALAGCLLSSIATAQITTDSKSVGGSGAFTSCGAFDPPTLCDGVTLASADVEFTFDAGTNTLTIELTNTSPVVVGVPNPAITNFFFNCPHGAVTGLSLINQTAAGGATPAWTLTFDADTSVAPNPNGADGMGAFSARLQGGTGNAIVNPAADTYGVPGGTEILGPATFTFAVTPAVGATLNAGTFADSFSHIPPGQRLATIVAHFQAGGPNTESGWISTPMECDPSAFMTGTPCLGCDVTFTLGGGPGCVGCLVISADPGPTLLNLGPPTGLIAVPVGLPFEIIINALVVPIDTFVEHSVTIPNNPYLINFTFYGMVALIEFPSGLLTVSHQFDFTILP